MAGTAEEVPVAGRKVRLTSADRVMFPERGFTKGDVFRYYLSVGEGITRALRDRPTTLQRFPEGIDGEAFYQKRVPARGVPPWIQTASVMVESAGNSNGGMRCASGTELPAMNGMPSFVAVSVISFAQSQR